jgi:hypothetical protein
MMSAAIVILLTAIAAAFGLLGATVVWLLLEEDVAQKT